MSSNEDTENSVTLLEHYQYKKWIMSLLLNSFERSKEEYKAIQDLSIKLLNESMMMCMDKNAKEASKVLSYLYSWPYIMMLIDNNNL